MTAATCPEGEFIELFERYGATEAAKRLNIAERRIYERRARIEKRIGRPLNPPQAPKPREENIHPGRLRAEIENGTVLVGSDCHYWPDVVTTAHRAFVKFCKEMKPSLVICNGDAFDGASISRHAPIMWEQKPSVILEMQACKDRLGEIEMAAGKARRVWNLGNHDARFESRLAQVAPEYANVYGLHLKDHFPLWEPAWSTWINGDVVVKHRYKGGIHATHNNTIWAGKTVVTGHLHSLKITPLSDYNGTRFGVDTGTMADPSGPQFEYLEDNPVNWRSGFIVLTFHKGRLLWPEPVHVIGEGQVEFRGKVFEV